MIVFWWFGCVRFITGENDFARCWYSGCSLIVHGTKYLLHLFLCVDGCACSMLGMGPGLVSMSPLRISRRCSASRLFCGNFFLVIRCFMIFRFIECVLFRCFIVGFCFVVFLFLFVFRLFV